MPATRSWRISVMGSRARTVARMERSVIRGQHLRIANLLRLPRISLRSMRATSLNRRLDRPAQLGRDLGLDAEPGLEGRARLMQQHAEAVDRRVAAPPRRRQQRGLE